MEKGPVCGMDIDPKSAAGSREYEGQIYDFCSPGCKKQFDPNPTEFLAETKP